MKNLVQVQPESKLPEISKFIEAVNDKKVKDSTEAEIREALRYCMVKIGLRAANYPVDLEKVLLIQHIYEFFPELGLSEIRLAFDWAIEGRTDVEVNCYENFSCRYLSGILKAYMALKTAVKVEEPKMIAYKPEPRQEGNYEEFKNSYFAERLKALGIKIPD